MFSACLKLTFNKSTFFEDNIYSKGESCIIYRTFYFDNFSLAYDALFSFLEYESDEGIFSNCDVSILSLIKVML